jgi:RNA:NAD 2'-phosphotransferase (TPT1/KptA family)
VAEMNVLMRKLYHGTLRNKVASIRKQGLLPQKGSLTADFHKNAVDLVYAVAEDRKGLLVTIITQQMAKSCLIQRSDDYHLDNFKRDLTAHGVVIVVKADML